MGNYKKKFGKHLQDLRKKRNYTSPSFDMLKKLADALEVDIELLFRFTDIETREELEKEICKKIKAAGVEDLKLILKIVNDVIL